MTTFLSRLRRKTRSESGASTVEFTICATVFLTGFFWVFESGLIMTKKMMLERALDMTIRDLRLATSPDYTHDYLKAQICSHTSVFKNCEDNLLLELTPVNLDAGFTRTASCIDRENEVTPVTTWNQGEANEVVYVRACILVDPMMPEGIALFPGVTESGIPLFADSAYVNEPA